MWDSSPLLLAIMICFYIRKKTVVCFLRRKVNNLNIVNNANAYFILCKYICKLYCCMLKYETIIQTGITCKKIPFYMRDSTCRWRIVKSTKKFWSYVKNFWLFYAKRFLYIVQSYFLTHKINRSYCQILFLPF